MKLFNILAASLLFLSSCATYTYNLPVVGPDSRIKPVKDNRPERTRAGNVLFVNRSPGVYREVAVYDGHHSYDQLFVFDSSGLPALVSYPIGEFYLDPPVSRERPDEDTEGNTELVNLLYPGRTYTLFILNKTMSGGLIGRPMVITRTVSRTVLGEKYHYKPWLGPRAGETVYETVNDVEYLPNVSTGQYAGDNYLLDLDVDINMLLRRGIHRITHP